MVSYYRNTLILIYDKIEVEAIIGLVFKEIFNWGSAQIVLNKNNRLSESEMLTLHFWLKDLAKGMPVQYVFGHTYFDDLKLKVSQSALIPRQETEELVYHIKNQHKQASTILDIGTGTGCIALALKYALPNAFVYAIDKSEAALELAQINAQNLQIEVQFEELDILLPIVSTNLLRKWDVIVSNPPYIPTSQKSQMHKNVLDYEPHTALFVKDEEPLIFYDKIADFAIQNLSVKGVLWLEICDTLGLQTKILLQTKGFRKVEIIKDINANDRIIKAQI